ncbi:hypothetical protein KKC83_02740 [Patescibacteria group bacterium]|nr:hypothetical protein [Candidatus Falkowbacteria bacterium]MBU3906385.1 hypothetical protein [Patescibacteria group bacterium]MBU4014978.1 hypothetical protein [Patescibacteria group bacterium]MBU4026434.1 hypothetical protein [Patescibacteria group bacterium]MBU4072743.1 hypothetical protein [Patescibacteria group bacterium]
MDIVIDMSVITELVNLPPHILVWRVFWYGGWLPVGITFLWGASLFWLQYIRSQWKLKHKFILLAIDIPRDNSQTPKAVENIFSYLAGLHNSINLIEKWWDGKFQLSISLEIVSIEGYIQFLIHTPEIARDLVESSIYSQYPDAEITEVNDYTTEAPSKFPDDEYDIYGAEFIQQKNSAYPIKTYKEFEHQMGAPETQYKDTMAALMDLMSSLRKGEQLWFQILLTPIGFDWPEIGDKEISKVIGEKAKSKKNILDLAIDGLLGLLGAFGNMIFTSEAVKEKKEEKEEMFKMMNLKPKEKNQIEAIEEKVSKLGFKFKMRAIYLARKEVMNKPKVFGGFVGFMKQFASMELNNLKPDMDKTATRAAYFFTESIINMKKMRIIRGYKDRDDTLGRSMGILNIEELATVWHFPVEASVRAPLIQKAPGRKAEAPMYLPVAEEPSVERTPDFLSASAEENNFNNEDKKAAMRKDKKQDAEQEFLADLADNNIKDRSPAEQRGGAAKAAPPGNLPFE